MRPSETPRESAGLMASTPPHPFLSVIVRTQGTRPDMLREALESLVRQTDAAWEALVVVHSPTQAEVERIQRVIEQRLPEGLGDRLSIHPAVGGGRARPLNVGIVKSRGDYVAFLDDDDVVLEDWVAVFRKTAEETPTTVVRSVTADVPIEPAPGSPGYRILEEPSVPPDRATFSLVEHLRSSRTPICSFAVPRAAIRDHGLQFTEELDILEDFDFLMRTVALIGIVDTGAVTSIYRRWTGPNSTWNSTDPAVWARTRTHIVTRLDELTPRLSPGDVERVRALYDEVELLRNTRFQLEADLRKAEVQNRRLLSDLARAQRRITQIESSTTWRWSAPLRRLLDRIRRQNRREA